MIKSDIHISIQESEELYELGFKPTDKLLFQNIFSFFREKYLLFSYVSIEEREDSKPKFLPHILTYNAKYKLETLLYLSPLYETHEEAELYCIKRMINFAKKIPK